jgi:hypothetical protein
MEKFRTKKFINLPAANDPKNVWLDSFLFRDLNNYIDFCSKKKKKKNLFYSNTFHSVENNDIEENGNELMN